MEQRLYACRKSAFLVDRRVPVGARSAPFAGKRKMRRSGLLNSRKEKPACVSLGYICSISALPVLCHFLFTGGMDHPLDFGCFAVFWRRHRASAGSDAYVKSSIAQISPRFWSGAGICLVFPRESSACSGAATL